MLDNNAARTIIFPDYKTQSPWYNVGTGEAICDDKTTRTYNEDGNRFYGYPCRQRLCIGSWATQEDVHTTVCNANMPFTYATTRVWTDWTYYYTKWGSINAICGLGKEASSIRSLSFNSFAKANGDLSNNVYSLSFDPHFQQTVSSNAHFGFKEESEGPEFYPTEGSPIVGKALYKYDLETVSTLTLNGYDNNDFVGNLTWYDTSQCIGGWNLTTNAVTLNDHDILPVEGGTTVIEF